MLRNTGVHATERRIRHDVGCACRCMDGYPQRAWRRLVSGACQPRYYKVPRPLYYHAARSITSYDCGHVAHDSGCYGVRPVYLPNEEWYPESTVLIRHPRYIENYYARDPPFDMNRAERVFRSDDRGYYHRRPSSVCLGYNHKDRVSSPRDGGRSYCSRTVSSRHIYRRPARKLTKKLSPILTCDCTSTSKYKHQNKDDSPSNSPSRAKRSHLSKEARNLSIDIYKILSLLRKVDSDEEEDYSSDSLLQRIHNLECPTSSRIDPRHAKLITECVQVYPKMGKRKTSESPLAKLRKATGVRSRLEALVTALKQYEAEKTCTATGNSSFEDMAKYKNNIHSNLPLIDAQSYFNAENVNSSNNKIEDSKVRKSIVLQTEEPTKSDKCVCGTMNPKNSDSTKEIKSPLCMKRKGSTDIKLRHESAKEKVAVKDSAKSKPGLTINCTEGKPGLMIRIGGKPGRKKQAPIEKQDKITKSWITKYLDNRRDSKDNNTMHTRWTNRVFYAKSSSTIFELISNVYKQMGINIKSKSDQISTPKIPSIKKIEKIEKKNTKNSSKNKIRKLSKAKIKKPLELMIQKTSKSEIGISSHNMVKKSSTSKIKKSSKSKIQKLTLGRFRNLSKNTRKKQKVEAYMIPETVIPGPVYMPVENTNSKNYITYVEKQPTTILLVEPDTNVQNQYSINSSNVLTMTNDPNSNFFRIYMAKDFFNEESRISTSDEEVHKIVDYEAIQSDLFEKEIGNVSCGEEFEMRVKVSVTEVLHRGGEVQTSYAGSCFSKERNAEEIITGCNPEPGTSTPRIEIQEFVDEDTELQSFPTIGGELREKFLQEDCRNWLPMSADYLSCSNTLKNEGVNSYVQGAGKSRSHIAESSKNIRHSSKTKIKNMIVPKDSIEAYRRGIFYTFSKSKWSSKIKSTSFIQWKNCAVDTHTKYMIGRVRKAYVAMFGSSYMGIFKREKCSFCCYGQNPCPLQEPTLPKPSEIPQDQPQYTPPDKISLEFQYPSLPQKRTAVYEAYYLTEPQIALEVPYTPTTPYPFVLPGIPPPPSVMPGVPVVPEFPYVSPTSHVLHTSSKSYPFVHLATLRIMLPVTSMPPPFPQAIRGLSTTPQITTKPQLATTFPTEPLTIKRPSGPQMLTAPQANQHTYPQPSVPKSPFKYKYRSAPKSSAKLVFAPKQPYKVTPYVAPPSAKPPPKIRPPAELQVPKPPTKGNPPVKSKVQFFVSKPATETKSPSKRTVVPSDDKPPPEPKVPSARKPPSKTKAKTLKAEEKEIFEKDKPREPNPHRPLKVVPEDLDKPSELGEPLVAKRKVSPNKISEKTIKVLMAPVPNVKPEKPIELRKTFTTKLKPEKPSVPIKPYEKPIEVLKAPTSKKMKPEKLTPLRIPSEAKLKHEKRPTHIKTMELTPPIRFRYADLEGDKLKVDVQQNLKEPTELPKPRIKTTDEVEKAKAEKEIKPKKRFMRLPTVEAQKLKVDVKINSIPPQPKYPFKPLHIPKYRCPQKVQLPPQCLLGDQLPIQLHVPFQAWYPPTAQLRPPPQQFLSPPCYQLTTQCQYPPCASNPTKHQTSPEMQFSPQPSFSQPQFPYQPQIPAKPEYSPSRLLLPFDSEPTSVTPTPISNLRLGLICHRSNENIKCNFSNQDHIQIRLLRQSLSAHISRYQFNAPLSSLLASKSEKTQQSMMKCQYPKLQPTTNQSLHGIMHESLHALKNKSQVECLPLYCTCNLKKAIQKALNKRESATAGQTEKKQKCDDNRQTFPFKKSGHVFNNVQRPATKDENDYNDYCKIKNRKIYITQMSTFGKNICLADRACKNLGSMAPEVLSLKITQGEKVTQIYIRKVGGSDKVDNLKSIERPNYKENMVNNNMEQIGQPIIKNPKKHLKMNISVKSIKQIQVSDYDITNRSFGDKFSINVFDDFHRIATGGSIIKPYSVLNDDQNNEYYPLEEVSESLEREFSYPQIDQIRDAKIRSNSVVESIKKKTDSDEAKVDDIVTGEETSSKQMSNISFEDYVNKLLGTADNIEQKYLQQVVDPKCMLQAIMALDASDFTDNVTLGLAGSDIVKDIITAKASPRTVKLDEIVNISSKVKGNAKTDSLDINKQVDINDKQLCCDKSESTKVSSIYNLIAEQLKNSFPVVRCHQHLEEHRIVGMNGYICPNCSASSLINQDLQQSNLMVNNEVLSFTAKNSLVAKKCVFNNSDTMIKQDTCITSEMLKETFSGKNKLITKVKQTSSNSARKLKNKSTQIRLIKKMQSTKVKKFIEVTASDTSGDKAIILANMRTCKYKTESVSPRENIFKNEEPTTNTNAEMMKNRYGSKLGTDINPAGILQSYKVKKAVLQIYTDETVGHQSSLVARLPKYLHM